MTKLIFWEKAAVFDCRSPLPVHRLSLDVGQEGVLTVMNERGVFRFPAKGGVVTPGADAFAPGENRLVFRAGDCLYHAESLWREGDALTPGGGDCMALLCEEKRKNEERWERTRDLERRLCLLEEAVFDAVLFEPMPNGKEETEDLK